MGLFLSVVDFRVTAGRPISVFDTGGREKRVGLRGLCALNSRVGRI